MLCLRLLGIKKTEAQTAVAVSASEIQVSIKFEVINMKSVCFLLRIRETTGNKI